MTNLPGVLCQTTSEVHISQFTSPNKMSAFANKIVKIKLLQKAQCPSRSFIWIFFFFPPRAMQVPCAFVDTTDSPLPQTWQLLRLPLKPGQCRKKKIKSNTAQLSLITLKLTITFVVSKKKKKGKKSPVYFFLWSGFHHPLDKIIHCMSAFSLYRCSAAKSEIPLCEVAR